MFSTYFRSDPFRAARLEAGLEAAPTRRSAGRSAAAARPALGIAAVAVVAALVLSTSSPASGASGATGGVAAQEAALGRATSARVAAEARVADISAELAEVEAELAKLGADDEELTEKLAAARRDLREYAVAAYIDGGQTEIFISSLSPEKAVALSWQTNLALGQSLSADEAAGRFEELKAANTPAMLAAATELDRISTRLEEARNDAIQAAAHERDAESALADARAAAERARLARQAAKEAAAAERAQQRRAAAAAASAPAARTASAAPVASTSAASGRRGDPSPSESATLARIRRCESGGNYSAISSSGRYRGAYQFDRGTWASVGGSGDPAAASAAEQDYRALLLLRARGTRPWPVCGR